MSKFPVTPPTTPSKITRIAASLGLILAVLVGLATPARPMALAPAQTVKTTNALAGVHTRFIDEVDEWKIARGMTMIREMGATWIVELFPWNYIEPVKSRFEWSNADRIVRHAQNNGITVIARLGFVPEWAKPRDVEGGRGTTVTHLDPQFFPDFANFAAEFVRHFSGQISHVIIWNEPNLSNEWGMRPPNPEQYAALLTASYAAIKRANPTTVVLAGALAPTLEPAGSPNAMNDLTYLEQLYVALRSSGNGRAYDALAVHAYGQTAPFDEPPSAMKINFRRTELVRDIMIANGDREVPVYITEGGWNDDKHWINGVSPSARIRNTIAALEFARTNWPWLRSLSFWVFKLTVPARGYRDHFTFVAPDLEPLPIYDEFKNALSPH